MRTVFVIDDDPVVRTAIKAMLKGVFRVIARPGGSKEPVRFDVAVIDTCLSNGYDALDLAKKLTIRAPVVFISASEDPKVHEQVARSGYSYIHKPINEFQLRVNIECALQRSKAHKREISRVESSNFINHTVEVLAAKNCLSVPTQSMRLVAEANMRKMNILDLIKEKHEALKIIDSTLS